MPKCDGYIARKVYITANIYFIKHTSNVGNTRTVKIQVECIRNKEVIHLETKTVMIDINSDQNMIKSFLHTMAFGMISEMTFKNDIVKRMWITMNWDIFKAGGYSDEFRDS